MKASQSTVSDIADQISVIAKHLGYDLTKMVMPSDKELFMVWHFIYADIVYDDSHPRFERYTRLFKQNRNFQLYPDGTDDRSLLTALKAAWKLATLRTASTLVMETFSPT